MRIGYLLLIHRSPAQFARLFRAIYDVKHLYMVHVDKKSDQQVFEDVRKVLLPYPNAMLLPRQRVTYTGFGMVQAELDAIQQLLSMDQPCELFISPDVQPLIQFYRSTRCPDEGLFQTVMMNSKFRETVVNNNLRYLEWLPTGRPSVLRLKDLQRMIARGAFFARKFDMEVDESVFDRLEEHLRLSHSKELDSTCNNV